VGLPLHKITPVPGDLIYYNWSYDNGSFDHVGIVIGCDGTFVYTIEGNTTGRDSSNREITGQVYRKTRKIKDIYIKGYSQIAF
jgi:hypothetical protein